MQFQLEMPFAPSPCDRAMIDAHFLSAVAELLVLEFDTVASCVTNVRMLEEQRGDQK